MAMTYTSLLAAKGTAGSIANFVNYTKLDTATILDEAQALLYSMLRVREMRTHTIFTMTVGSSYVALPDRFLDPIGTLFAPSVNCRFSHRDEGQVQNARVYSQTSGTLGTDPFMTTSGATTVAVTLASHGFSQGSSFYVAGATATGGLTLNGTFDIVSITDANTFVIETNAATAATSTVVGGGSSATYVCDNLVQGMPGGWAIWDERIQFDVAFATQYNCQLLYFQSLPLLSSSNATNFLTNRYPHLLRTACQTAAADFMKDDTEYQKGLTRLQGLVAAISVEGDLSYRGAEIETETP